MCNWRGVAGGWAGGAWCVDKVGRGFAVLRCRASTAIKLSRLISGRTNMWRDPGEGFGAKETCEKYENMKSSVAVSLVG